MVNFARCQVSAVIKSSAHPVRNRENDKYLNGILDLTAHQEAGVAKIKAWDAEFFCLFVGNLGNCHNPNKCPVGKAGGVSFQKPNCRVYLVNCQ